MKNIIPSALVIGILMLSSGCDGAKTSVEAPNSAGQNVETVDPGEVKDNKKDAISDIRRNQLDSDIRAREQRNQIVNDGDATDRSDSDIASEVRSKLEANLPGSSLVVESKEGAVVVTGTVTSEENLQKIQKLASEIKGVKSTAVKARIASAAP